MTDEQVISILAEKLGWKPEVRKRWAGMDNVHGWGMNPHLSDGDSSRKFTAWQPGEDLLASKDALEPVLEKLSEEEWYSLRRKLFPYQNVAPYERWLLMLSARDLAYAIAEAITPKS